MRLQNDLGRSVHLVDGGGVTEHRSVCDGGRCARRRGRRRRWPELRIRQPRWWAWRCEEPPWRARYSTPRRTPTKDCPCATITVEAGPETLFPPITGTGPHRPIPATPPAEPLLKAAETGKRRDVEAAIAPRWSARCGLRGGSDAPPSSFATSLASSPFCASLVTSAHALAGTVLIG